MNTLYKSPARHLMAVLSSAVTCFLQCLVCTVWLWSAAPYAATQAEIDTMREQALAYLFLNQDADGYWDGPGKTDIQATALTLQAFHSSGIQHGSSQHTALLWLANAHPLSNTAHGFQISSLAQAGWNVSKQLTRLTESMNNHYAGWGAYPGHQPSFPDTAIIHDAWHFSGITNPAVTSYSKNTAQNSDGGWPYMPITLSVAMAASSALVPTAYATLALSNSKQLGNPTFGGKTEIANGINWLLAKQLGDGGYADDNLSTTGNAYETALVLRAIKSATVAAVNAAVNAGTAVDSALSFLVASQSGNGSWNNDVMATAAVLNALENVNLIDGDKDGIPDSVELLTFTDPLVADAGLLLTGVGDAIAGLTTAEATLAKAQVGEAFSFFLPFSGGTPVAFTAGGGLPPGFTLNVLTGDLSGTPESGGDYPFSYTVSFIDGEPEELVVALNIEGPVKVNVPLPIGSIVGLALLLLPISLWGRAKQTIVSFAFVGLVMPLLAFSPNTLAETQLPANIAKQITDAFIGHPSQRDETVQSIEVHINALSKALAAYHSEDARKMFAVAHRTALDALNRRLNEELAGTRERYRQYHGHQFIKFTAEEIAQKDAALQMLFDQIDALQSLDGDKVLNAFLSIKERLKAGAAVRHRKNPMPTLHQVEPDPEIILPASDVIPAYLAQDYRERASRMYAFNEDILLLAVAPNTPVEALSCSYTSSDLADDGQDVTLTPEIHAQAKALEYSPIKIYEFVANEITFEPYYGAIKGAHATLLTQSGGATDQSSLLIALLRAANIPARYVRGDVESRIGSHAEIDARVVKWLQVKSLKAAKERLALHGNPAASFSANNYLRFSHVWVEACVPYAHYQGARFDQAGHRWIPLDPSFEVRSYREGITTSESFNFDAYLSKFQDKMPEEYFESQVNETITAPDKNVKDVGYQSEKHAIQLDILPASLPYNVKQFTNWDNSGIPETATLPDAHRYFLTLEVKNNVGTSLGASITRPLREVVLNRLTVYFKGATPSGESRMQAWRLNGGTLPNSLSLLPVILIDGVEVATGNVSVLSATTTNKVDMRVTIEEYRNNKTPFGDCPVVTGTKLINDACFDTIRAANYHSFQAWAYQGANAILTSLASELIDHTNANTNLADDIENTLGRFLHYISLSYMRDISRASKRIGKLTGNTGDSGIHLGLTGSQSHVDKVLDLPFGIIKRGFYIDVPGGQSNSVNIVDASSDQDAFLLTGYALSAYESNIWQESARLDAVSTVRGLQQHAKLAEDICGGSEACNELKGNYKISKPEQNFSQSVQRFTCFIHIPIPICDFHSKPTDVLKNTYGALFVSDVITPLLNQGQTITIPAFPTNYQGWVGSVYAIEKPGSAGFLISGDYAGGYTVSDPVSYLFNPLVNTSYGWLGSSASSFGTSSISGSDASNSTPPLSINNCAICKGVNTHTTSAGDPVNLVNGNFYHQETDLTIPHRDLPFVFERFYNSREPQDGPLGFGWTHSFNHFLRFIDENPDSVESADDTDGTTSQVAWVDGTNAEKRLIIDGATALGVSGSSSFSNGDGQHFNFTRETNGSFTITEKNGLIYRFEISAGDVDDKAKLTQIQSRNGNTLTLTYNGNELDKVTDSTGRFISFTYTANRISRVEDWTGRAHEYTYSAEGDLISYKNPLALAGEQAPVSYDYFTAADAPTIDHAIKSITLPKGNGMTFEYYVDGRVFRHTNTAGETFSFQYNDFRRETIVTDSRGFTKQYFFNEYGNPVEIINEEGGISSYEYTDPSDNYLRTAVVNEARLRTEYEYNSNGTLVLQRNPSGSTVEYSNFNAFEQPGKIKDANGNYSLLKYDVEGNVTDKIALKAGVGSSVIPSAYVPAQADLLSWITNNYSSAGNLLSSTQVRDVTTAEGFSQQWQFDASQLYATQIQRCGDKTGDGVINLTDDPCDVAVLAYDTLGRLELGVNGRFEKVEYRYDDLDRLVRGTDALGNIRDFGFDANGNAHEQSLFMFKLGQIHYNRNIDTDQENSETLTRIDSSSSRFNDSDRLRVSINAGGHATYFSYDPMGNVKTVTNPDNYQIRFEYDGLGRVTSAFDEEGREAKRDLDPIGRMRSLTDPNGNAETFSYYSAANDGRLEKQCDALNRCTTFIYDNNGNVTSFIDHAGSVTQATYDALNRPLRIVEPKYTDPVHGQVRPVTRYIYGLLGAVTQVDAGYTDVLGFAGSDITQTQQSTVFDDWGRALTVTDALGQTFEYEYNVHGYRISDALPNNATIIRDYGYGGLVISENNKRIKRDPLGNILKAGSYQYAYNSAHRLKTASIGNTSLQYAWSAGGLLESVKDNSGNSNNYRYDKTGRLQAVSRNDTHAIGYRFDDGGRLREKRYPSGVTATYNYFNDNRLKDLLVKGASTLLQQEFSYDNLGRRSTLTENLNGTTTSSSYSYDNLSRLTQETLGANTQSFTYDTFGNRVTHNKFDGTTDFYQHDAAHQLKTLRENNASGAVKARYQYDLAGNQIRSCEGSSAALIPLNNDFPNACDIREYRFYQYNSLQRMTRADSYEYTGANVLRRSELTDTSVDKHGLSLLRSSFSYGTLGERRSSQRMREDDYRTPDAVKTTQQSGSYIYDRGAIYRDMSEGAYYLHGAAIDEPLMRFSDGGEVTSYHQNARNSVVLTTSANDGSVVGSQSFDAFGNQQASSGSIKQYGYTGREPDASGLMYYRARYYDPQRGRFTQRDPKGMIDGINQYAYVRNNPVNRIDPNGTVSIGTNNYSSANNNYFSGHSSGTSGQTLFNTSSSSDLSANVELSNSLGFDLPSLPRVSDDDFASFLYNRLIDGGVRDDLNSAFSKVSVASAALSVPALASGNVPAYATLQTVSLISGAGALATSFNEPTLAGFVSDGAAASISYKLGVTTTPFGRATLAAFESISAISSYLFYEVSKNEE